MKFAWGWVLFSFLVAGTVRAEIDQYAGLNLWLKADAGIAASDQADVNEWADQSGQGRDARYDEANIFSELPPTYDQSNPLIGGMPSVRFNNQHALELDLGFVVGSDYTVIVVNGRDSNGAANFYIAGEGSSTNENLILGYEQPNQLRLSHFANDLDAFVEAYDGTETWSIDAFRFSQSTGRTVLHNGFVVASDTRTTALLTNVGPTLGHFRAVGGTFWFQGGVAEVIAFDRALTDQELEEIHAILSEKYSLASDPQEPVEPEMLEVSEYLATPATGFKALVPVVLVTHVPTRDGENLDRNEAVHINPPEWRGDSIEDVLSYVETISVRQKFILEERTRFRGYKTPNAPPYLGYTVVAHYLFKGPLPVTSRRNPFDNGQTMVDFAKLIEAVGGEAWVNEHGVREFWFNNYFNDRIQFWESNMSSPTTGDISNSDRFNGDLPVYDSTYVVYGVNYFRTQAEAIHNHGHQEEAIFDYIDRRYTGRSDFFWGEFTGMPPPHTDVELGRCGWTHMPPFTASHYGYLDPGAVESDCENWRPGGGGATRTVSSNYFGSLQYAWPGGGNVPQKAESQFYLWWGQNFPGYRNQIPYGNRHVENWWRFIEDWDSAINSGLMLFRNDPPDSDGDGVADTDDAFPENPAEWLDTDTDGIGNNTDPDDDNDGISDGADPFPTDAARPRRTVADLNGDSQSDLLLRNTTSGAWWTFDLDAFRPVTRSTLKVFTAATWQHQATADFDGDWDSDILIRRDDGIWRIFEMDNGGVAGSHQVQMFQNPDWQAKGAFDFDGDLDADVLARNAETGSWRVFISQAGRVASSTGISLFPSRAWVFQGLEDYDGDGDGDVLLRHSTRGWWRVFEIEDGQVVSSNPPGTLFQSSDWQYVTSGDMDNDGTAEIVLRRQSTGDWRVFKMRSRRAVRVDHLNLFQNLLWVFEQIGDFDRDGDQDLLLRRTDTGQWRFFEIENRRRVGTTAPSIWQNPAFQLQQ